MNYHSHPNASFRAAADYEPGGTEYSESELRALERDYCSHGDTVHYLETPPIFARCEGSYVYDETGTPFLDLQMWYSAVNFGYANPRLNAAAKCQLDTLPQVAS